MNTLIETERLTMRKFTLEDLDAVYEFSKCEQTSKYTGDAGSVKTKADAEKIIREIWLTEYEKYGYARYALVHKTDNRVIGFCGMKFETRLNATDVGYRMLPQYWGKGLGKEAVAAVLEYARDTLGLNRILGEVVTENIASNKILLGLGFQLIKTYPQDGFNINRYEIYLR